MLARHCDEVGRDRSEIRNTTIGRISPDTDVDMFVAEMAQYAALGFEHVQLGLLGTEPAQLVERVCHEDRAAPRRALASRAAAAGGTPQGTPRRDTARRLRELLR